MAKLCKPLLGACGGVTLCSCNCKQMFAVAADQPCTSARRNFSPLLCCRTRSTLGRRWISSHELLASDVPEDFHRNNIIRTLDWTFQHMNFIHLEPFFGQKTFWRAAYIIISWHSFQAEMFSHFPWICFYNEERIVSAAIVSYPGPDVANQAQAMKPSYRQHHISGMGWRSYGGIHCFPFYFYFGPYK